MNIKEQLDVEWEHIEILRINSMDGRTWFNHWAHTAKKICGPDTSIEWQSDGSCIVAGVMLFLPIKSLDSKVQ